MNVMIGIIMVLVPISIALSILCFRYSHLLDKEITKNKNNFENYAKLNDKSIQEVRNNMIPLYIMKREFDLYDAEKIENFEECQKIEADIRALKQYAKQNNITI